MRLTTAIALLATFTSDGAAQFVSQDARAQNLTVVRSPGNANVTVSYKQPNGVCKTAFDRQKQYTGWVNVPGDYPTNLFFWFVEARNPTENLTVWLNGGPGSSSMYGFFTGNGPCAVIEKGLNKYDTVAREWGWDRASNMLFIDQVRALLERWELQGSCSHHMAQPSRPFLRPAYERHHINAQRIDCRATGSSA